MKYSKLQISSGHWDNPNSGASGVLNEVLENRKVSKYVQSIFSASQVPVKYIEDNVSKTQKENVNYLIAQHNKDGKAFNVQIHFNAGGDGDAPNGIGVEVLYVNPWLKDLSAKVSGAISKASGLKNRGAKYRDNLGFLNKTTGAAILIEVAFVNSKVDAKLYNENFKAICSAIAKVLAEHMEVDLNIEMGEAMMEITLNEMHATLRAQCVAKIEQGYNNKKFGNFEWVERARNGTLTLANYVGLSTLIDSK